MTLDPKRGEARVVFTHLGREGEDQRQTLGTTTLREVHAVGFRCFDGVGLDSRLLIEGRRPNHHLPWTSVP